MSIKRYLHPPVIETDLENQQVATMLHYMLLWALVITTSALSLHLLLPDESERTLPSVFAFLTVCLVSFVLLHNTYVRQSAMFMVILFWFAITVVSVFEAGVLLYELEYLVAPVALAFLTLGRRWGVGMSLLSLGSILVVAWMTMNSLTPEPVQNDLPTTVFIATLPRMIIVSTMGIFFYINKRALETAQCHLRASEERNRVVIDLMGDAAYQHDMDGIIVGINHQATVLFGYEEKELVGKHISVLDPNFTQDILALQLPKMELHTPLSVPSTLVRKDGHTRDVDTRAVLLDIAGEQLVFGVTRDVSEAKRMQQALLDSQIELAALNERLQLVADNIPVFMAYFDKDETIVFMNQPFTTLGFDLAGSIGRSMKRVFRPKMYEYVSPFVKRSLAGERVQVDLPVVDQSGRQLLVDSSLIPHVIDNEVVGFFGLGLDVTDDRLLENALIASERLQQEAADRLRVITDNLPLRIAYIDAEENVQFANRDFQLQHKRHSDELIGKSLDQILPGDTYRQHLRPQFQSALEGHSVQFDLTTLDEPGQESRIAEVSYVPHFDQDRVIGVFALERDVTEERRRELLTQQSQRLESLGLLAGGIAHDFNNLLVAILGQSSLASAKMDGDHPSARHVEKAVKAARRASSLTNQMLAYSGQGHFEIRPINFNTLISQNLHLFEASIGKNIALTTNFEEKLPMVEADTAQMQQVIMNLIINAAQAIGSKNGQITLTTDTYQIIESEQNLWLFTGEPLDPGIYVSVEVQDDGCGMNEEQLSQIFEPFFSTKETGSGLGLSAVLGIIRGHKGGIRVYSEVGKGTVFRMLIPVENSAESEKQLKTEVGTTFIRGPLPNSVLVIDDERHVAEAIGNMLTEVGFNSIVAYSGKEGVQLYHEHIDDIALVVLDLVMPEMDGQRVYEELQAVDPFVNVLLTSGYNRSEALNQFNSKEPVGFIQKPYTSRMLVSELERLLPVQSKLSA